MERAPRGVAVGSEPGADVAHRSAVAAPAPSGWLRLPSRPASLPIVYSPSLVTYVAMLAAATAALAAIFVPTGPIDVASFSVGAAVGFAIEATAVSTISRVRIHWSASGFVYLVMSFLLGPAGCLGGALAAGFGGWLRYRNGWFRFVFNTANTYLSNMVAWGVFVHLEQASSVPSTALAAGVAGTARFGLNLALLAIVVRLSDPNVVISRWLRTSLIFLPYSIGYGWAAYGGVLLHDRAGALGLTFLLIPVVLVQFFLIILGQSAEAEDRAQAEHARERDLLIQRVLDSSESERRRIARDLHDGVVQDLSALALGLSQTAGKTGDAATAAAANRAAMAARAAMDELRTLLRELSPPNLQSIGLATALGDLVVPLREEGLRVTVSIDPQLDRVAGVTTLFRISQEALRNVSKHAQASTVEIRAWREDALIHLEISDDGRGFALDEAEAKRSAGHMGIELLHDLAVAGHGTLAVDSEPGRGTRVHASIPLRAS